MNLFYLHMVKPTCARRAWVFELGSRYLAVNKILFTFSFSFLRYRSLLLSDKICEIQALCSIKGHFFPRVFVFQWTLYDRSHTWERPTEFETGKDVPPELDKINLPKWLDKFFLIIWYGKNFHNTTCRIFLIF